MKLRSGLISTALIAVTLSACSHTGELTSENGGGIYALRSACPVPGIPAGTGDMTIFNPQGSTDASAIDVTAAISDVRTACQDAGSDVISTATFTIVGLRRDAGAARQVVVPYFNVAMQGGSKVAAKQIGQAVLSFPAGSVHAQTQAQATVRVNRSVATLPPEISKLLTRPRKAGAAEAATDPLADPAVRTALANATFEQLIGFQLTQDQLKYNATR